MRYLLDANTIIVLLNDSNAKLARRIRQEQPTEMATSAIVAHELFYGAFKSGRREQNLVLIDTLRFPIVEFDKEDARFAGKLRALLRASGTPIGPYDVLIAGQALARNMILITHNAREFARVPGLRCEDWQA